MPKDRDKKLELLIQKYIDQAVDVLQHAAVGDFSKRLPLPKSENQFTQLSVAINLMVEDLAYSSKEIETKLSETEKQLSTTFENSSIGMALVSPKGLWLMVNPAICNIVGYSEEELLKKKFQDITHPDDLDKDLDYVKKVLAGKMSNYQMEKRYLHKDGHVVWGLLSVSLVRDEKERPIYFISQVQDISTRKEAEKNLKQKLDEMEKMNKLMIGRELQMVKLKDTIKKLQAKK